MSMQGINLHAVVRGAVRSINPDETVTLHRAAGQINVDGVVRPCYEAGEEVVAQWQPDEKEALGHTERVNSTFDSEQVFLYSEAASPVAGLQRVPIARMGDMLLRGELWYLVTAVIEDWSRVGWINVTATLQNKAPDFSASGWWQGGGSSGA